MTLPAPSPGGGFLQSVGSWQGSSLVAYLFHGAMSLYLGVDHWIPSGAMFLLLLLLLLFFFFFFFHYQNQTINCPPCGRGPYDTRGAMISFLSKLYSFISKTIQEVFPLWIYLLTSCVMKTIFFSTPAVEQTLKTPKLPPPHPIIQ